MFHAALYKFAYPERLDGFMDAHEWKKIQNLLKEDALEMFRAEGDTNPKKLLTHLAYAQILAASHIRVSSGKVELTSPFEAINTNFTPVPIPKKY